MTNIPINQIEDNSDVNPNPYLIKEIKNYLKKHGKTPYPIILIPCYDHVEKTECYEIVDGFQMLHALFDLDRKELTESEYTIIN